LPANAARFWWKSKKRKNVLNLDFGKKSLKKVKEVKRRITAVTQCYFIALSTAKAIILLEEK
jgi:hypothetical protein